MLVHGRYPPSITKSKTGVEQTKEKSKPHFLQVHLHQGVLVLPLDPTNTKNNRKDIEWKIRFIFYFHIQKFQTRYSHTTSIPPNSERNVLERRYSEEGAVGSSHPPPLPSCSLSPTFIMVYFFQFITNRVFEKTFMCCWYEVRLRCSIDIFAQPPALLATSLDLPQTRAVSNLMKASNV